MDIRIPLGRLHYLFEDPLPLRIVRRRSARQQEPAVDMLLDEPIGRYHPHRVFQAIEPGDLGDDRFVVRDAILGKDPVDHLLRQFPVLVAQRIDGRGDQELPDGQSPGEGGRRKYGRIVLHDKLLQKSPDLLFRLRQIDVAAPDPFVVRPFLHQDNRLGIVDEDDIAGGIHLRKIAPARFHEYLEILLADIDLSAVQGVMEFLRDLEELFSPLDHIPANIQPQLPKQGDHPAEDLRHAAADGRGVDIQYPLSPQVLGDQPEILNHGFPDDRGIVIDLYHGCSISLSIIAEMVRRKSSIV